MSEEQREYFITSSSRCISCGHFITSHSQKNPTRHRLTYKPRAAWLEVEDTLLRKMLTLMPSTIDYKVIMHHWEIRGLPTRTRKAFEIKISGLL
jgi:hypothetical protein